MHAFGLQYSALSVHFAPTLEAHNAFRPNSGFGSTFGESLKLQKMQANSLVGIFNILAG